MHLLQAQVVEILGKIILIIVFLAVTLTTLIEEVRFISSKELDLTGPPPRVWLWNQITQSKGKEITCVHQQQPNGQ